MRITRKSLLYFALGSTLLTHTVVSQSNDTSNVDATTVQPAEVVTAQSGSIAYEETAPTAMPVPEPTVIETASAPAVVSEPEAPAAQVSPSPAPVSVQQPEATDDFLRMGMGVQCGVRFHQPEEFNSFVSDLWNSFLTDNVYAPVDKKQIGPGVFLSLNGTFDIGSRFQVVPFAQGMWAGKQFYFRGGIIKDMFVNTYTAMGGVNLFFRVINQERYSIRLGGGGYGAYTIARITGDIDDTKLSGSGYGVRGLIGTEWRLNNRVVLTLDGGTSWGISEFSHTSGTLKASRPNITYPKEFAHFGIEVCPGVVFYF